ncbi:phage/plasmid primase, P4 family [Helcococcus massiliensis]|uniref:phage/plasmid primase, P4 family n=1 Tax=Helcococcus massiliensis TaxID=2040290 RepID=UPI000CDECDBE|nr:phage/plasmid primase, P4 family [Helcococcus massiliensis]
MKIYASNLIGVESNCIYQEEIDVIDIRSFEKAASYDHVMARYKNNYRSNDNFIESDCIPMDIDNDHSENPSDWISTKDLKKIFDGVKFFIVYSRNHKKEKNNKSARPRMHIYFPIKKVTNLKEYVGLKERLSTNYTFFDGNALDGARFFFGVKNPVVEIVRGNKYITDILNDDFEDFDNSKDLIKEGSRNPTMNHFAGKVLIRYGNTDEARKLFDKKASFCSPPLEDDELEKLWKSACKFYKKIASSEGYVPPEKYTEDVNLRPSEFSDIGQAEVFVREYKDKIRFSPSTGFLVYNDSYWEESELKAQGYSQDLVLKQIEEIDNEFMKMEEEIKNSGIREILSSMSEKKAMEIFNQQQKILYYKLTELQAYKKYAVKRGDTRAIHATLKESKPMLEIDQRKLDTNEFLLNTPSFTVDLKTGEKREHNADDYITKETLVDPSDKNIDLWLDALDTFFVKDKELIDYVQKVAGISLIGKVYIEALIIAYGDGRNGKSTFWNTISRVLDLYSGSISADILTVNSKRNAKPELAETRGKRLLIAAELQEGLRLNTSNVKQLCSTDEIVAEKKYRDPFKFIPSHTLVLYTNHLPRVGALDEGTWRRLIVIPFEAKIQGSSDIKNYTDYLVENAGGAVLKWLIDGAKKAIDEDFKFNLPKKVSDAINEYKESNNWFKHFLNECCEIDSSYEEKSGEVYQEYRAYCLRIGDYVRSTTDFYSALSSHGFNRVKLRDGIKIQGLKLKSEFV